jgi:spore coat protein CotF
MYQQNYSNQQAMNQQSQGSQQNQQGNGNVLQEQDWGNLLLGEMKRTAREYTTAALESSHPSICQTFQSLAQKTMQDQAQLFSALSQINGYSSIPMAHPQEIQHDLQQRSQKAEQLQSLVQQCLQGGYTAGAGMYQPQAEQQASFQPAGQAGANTYGSYSTFSSGAPSGFSTGQSTSTFQGSQSSQGSLGSQGYTQGYGQGYSPGYTNNMSSTNNTSQYSGKQGSSQSPASSTFNNNNNRSSFTSSSSMDATRGGNSFNWTASEEDENSPSTESSQLLQSQNGNSGSKYIL